MKRPVRKWLVRYIARQVDIQSTCLRIMVVLHPNTLHYCLLDIQYHMAEVRMQVALALLEEFID